LSKIFELHYWCQNNGDGSVSVNFEKDEKTARKKDGAQSEGWGESSVSSVKLMMINDKLHRYTYDYKEIDGKYFRVDKWIPVKTS
jgi:hypothetical protein